MIVEIIPYSNFKQKIEIVSQELEKKRRVEVWPNYIYSEGKRRVEDGVL